MQLELIDKIRRRPALYLGSTSPIHLSSFIAGYYYRDSLPERIEEDAYVDFNSFNDWVANKLGHYQSTSGWAYMIEDQQVVDV